MSKSSKVAHDREGSCCHARGAGVEWKNCETSGRPHTDEPGPDPDRVRNEARPVMSLSGAGSAAD
jgi:hypothetical protein